MRTGEGVPENVVEWIAHGAAIALARSRRLTQFSTYLYLVSVAGVAPDFNAGNRPQVNWKPGASFGTPNIRRGGPTPLCLLLRNVKKKWKIDLRRKQCGGQFDK
jgi:hypothetical protein